jgi:membrane protein DedA with SNARE-associated domain
LLPRSKRGDAVFDWLVETFSAYPYPGVAIVFLLCGIGLPLPEELVLGAAGYVCFSGIARVEWMVPTCALAILLGDLIPFTLGRKFGARLLRIRWLRVVVTKRRLATFDSWFRRRGDLVIFFARFIAGIRVVAYFTAGTMRMRWTRFLLLDVLGIALIAPTLVYAGYAFGPLVDDLIHQVQRAERTILIALGLALVAAVLWWWMRRAPRRRRLLEGPSETFVGPTVPPPDKAAPADQDRPGEQKP